MPKSETEISALADAMRRDGFAEARIAERVVHWRGEWAEAYAPYVVVDPEVMGGVPVFRGTRVTVATAIDNVLDGMTIGEIVSEFETLNREDVEATMAIWRGIPRP